MEYLLTLAQPNQQQFSLTRTCGNGDDWDSLERNEEQRSGSKAGEECWFVLTSSFRFLHAAHSCGGSVSIACAFCNGRMIRGESTVSYTDRQSVLQRRANTYILLIRM